MNTHWGTSGFETVLYVRKGHVYVSELPYFSHFKDTDVAYVPCSGLNGENLVKSPSPPHLSEWYGGPTLLEEIDRLEPPPRLVDREFRCCVSDIFKGIYLFSSLCDGNQYCYMVVTRGFPWILQKAQCYVACVQHKHCNVNIHPYLHACLRHARTLTCTHTDTRRH